VPVNICLSLIHPLQIATDAQLPPVTSGLTGVYWASGYDSASNRWLDVSGQGNHAGTSGIISKETAADLNGKDYLHGDTGANVNWPQVRPT
jgi:hypothetical protein